jgi:hypothetical protein
VFFIDADERATEQVRDEVKREISRIDNTMSDETLLWIPRRNYIFGAWIQHSGWSPDFQPRVLKRGKAYFDPTRPVHELVIPNGSETHLTQPLVHYNYETLAQFRSKQNKYTRFEAQMMYEQGIRARARSFVSMPVREFVRRELGRQAAIAELSELGANPKESALRWRREAQGQLAKARSAFQKREYRDSILHAKLVERSLDEAITAQRSAEQRSSGARSTARRAV